MFTIMHPAADSTEYTFERACKELARLEYTTREPGYVAPVVEPEEPVAPVVVAPVKKFWSLRG